MEQVYEDPLDEDEGKEIDQEDQGYIENLEDDFMVSCNDSEEFQEEIRESLEQDTDRKKEVVDMSFEEFKELMDTVRSVYNREEES